MDVLRRLEKLERAGYATPMARAAVYIGLGRNDEALEQLERAFKIRDSTLPFARVIPTYDSIRSDPRFKDLMRRVGFPED
jgi:hypothetical protein